MKKINKAQSGAKMRTKKTVRKKSVNPADEYPTRKDRQGFPLIGGGEGRRPPFKGGGKMKKRKY